MIRKWLGVVAILIFAAVLLNLSSCARSQKLQAITISPSAFTYGSAATPGVQQTPIPLTAYGSFIHPPETKDITTSVTWASDVTPVAIVDSSGHLTAGTSCGIANISATMFTSGDTSGNVVVGTMTTTVEGPASEGCPQSTATHNLSVNVTAGAADGVITSSPGGISCGPTCSAPFAANSQVSLTAVPNNGKLFLGWGGCTSVSVNTCSVTLDSDTTVTASFN
jgi:hypothetical protein